MARFFVLFLINYNSFPSASSPGLNHTFLYTLLQEVAGGYRNLDWDIRGAALPPPSYPALAEPKCFSSSSTLPARLERARKAPDSACLKRKRRAKQDRRVWLGWVSRLTEHPLAGPSGLPDFVPLKQLLLGHCLKRHTPSPPLSCCTKSPHTSEEMRCSKEQGRTVPTSHRGGGEGSKGPGTPPPPFLYLQHPFQEGNRMRFPTFWEK